MEIVKTVTSFLLWLQILCYKVIFLVIVETSDMIQFLLSRTDNIGGIDISIWDKTRVVLSLFVFQATLFLFLSFLVRGLAILGTQKMWVQKV